jgi:hypothetical protein
MHHNYFMPATAVIELERELEPERAQEPERELKPERELRHAFDTTNAA